MSAGFTPGPWSVRKNEYGDVVVDSESIGVCNVGRNAMGDGPAVANFSHEQGPLVEADARLIAAAPDLYEALRVMVADFGDYPASERPCRAFDLAEAALAKARGELPQPSVIVSKEG